MNIAIMGDGDQELAQLYRLMQEEIQRLLRNDILVEYFTSMEEYSERIQEEWIMICPEYSDLNAAADSKQISGYSINGKEIVRIREPVSEELVHSIIKQIQGDLGISEQIRLQFPEEKEIVLADVFYIHCKNRRSVVYHENQEAYSCFIPQGDIAYILDIYDSFFWVNQSTVVNLKMIESFHHDAGLLYMKNGHYVKVTAGRRRKLWKKLVNG